MSAQPETVLRMFTVYDHPRDLPNAAYVVREWHIVRGKPEPVPTRRAWTFPTLEEVRAVLAHQGLARLERNEGDDPVIVETWL